MQLQKLVLTATILGAATCSGGGDTAVGMRFDGVKVECMREADGVSVCAPVAKADACDVATVLWPPNHKMMQFTLAECAPAPGCGDGTAVASATASITSITADEQVEVGASGDGHTTTGAIQILDPLTFAVRSERQGGGDGRVYRVHFADATGAAGACEFQVPHDQGPVRGAIDSGTVVAVTP